MTLSEYNKKRKFSSTSEPQGKVKQTNSKKLRFVVQYHKATTNHYDFRLEYNGVLLSWAVPKGPSLNPKDKRLAVMVEDHPVDYISFEGIIPKGNYGAGSVEIFDKGFYTAEKDFEKGLKKGHIIFSLFGEKLKGNFSLVKIDDKNWLLIKGQDKFATDKKTLPQQANKNPFSTCDANLALLTSSIPKGKDWIFEIKYDGYRILSFVENKKVKLKTRNNNDYTKKFGAIEKSLLSISKQPFILDGEIVCFDENGRSDFSLLQDSIKNNSSPFYYVVFDILSFNGKDLRKEELSARKEILNNLLINSPKNIIKSEYIVGKGKETFNFAKKNNLEGIVAKNLKSLYTGTRNGDWLKIKCYKRQEFVIGGYTKTDKNKYVSAILVGYYKNKKLCYAGKVGTGFNDKQRQELCKIFEKHKGEKNYFVNSPKSKEDITYLTPKLIAEIKFTELTKENILRQPSFIALREDKNPLDIKLEIEND